MMPACPLCAMHSEIYFQGDRCYLRCLCCGYVFLDPSERLSPYEEKSRYLLHQNDLQEPGYRQWLENFLQFVLENVLEKNSYNRNAVLDFGSGPSPALAVLLEEKGFDVVLEDPFFAPGHPPGPFDLITTVEVLEHVFHPQEVLFSLSKRLVKGGCLAIATEFLPAKVELFSEWHYRTDPTHVGFFTVESLISLARNCGLCHIVNDGVRYIAFRTGVC